MNLKTWIPLALAVVFGLVAMKVARDVVVNRAAPADPQGGLVDVVVLKRDVTAGTALRAEDLTMGRISADVSTDAAFRNAADVEGRVARATMFKGQAVIEPLLAPVGTGTGLQAIVPRVFADARGAVSFPQDSAAFEKARLRLARALATTPSAPAAP